MDSAPDARAASASSAAEPASEAARQFGPFELLRALGAGASGRVFAARDLRSEALIALKVVALDHSDPHAAAAARERFVREAMAVGRLHHPGLVEVLGCGQLDGQGWLAMELAPGVSLLRYAQPARLLPPEAVAALGARIAKGLSFAHSQGVIHRDVKPANVIVDWSRDSVKLVDFGLARWTDRSATRSGQLIGSPEYLAPELLAGAEAGPEADLYGLGVTLYELLLGRRPHSAPTLGGLLRAVAHEPAPDLALQRPDLPNPLCRIVMTLLAKSPARRASVAAMLADNLAAAGARIHPGRP